MGAVFSALATAIRFVSLPGRFVGISSFGLEGRTVSTAPTVARDVGDIVWAGRESEDCADDGCEDSEATGEVSISRATGVAFETPATG
jgi:hypothetical protein